MPHTVHALMHALPGGILRQRMPPTCWRSPSPYSINSIETRQFCIEDTRTHTHKSVTLPYGNYDSLFLQVNYMQETIFNSILLKQKISPSFIRPVSSFFIFTN